MKHRALVLLIEQIEVCDRKREVGMYKKKEVLGFWRTQKFMHAYLFDWEGEREWPLNKYVVPFHTLPNRRPWDQTTQKSTILFCFQYPNELKLTLITSRRRILLATEYLLLLDATPLDKEYLLNILLLLEIDVSSLSSPLAVAAALLTGVW